MERTRLHDSGGVSSVHLRPLLQFSKLSAKLHIALVEASDCIDPIRHLEEMDGQKRLMTMHCCDVTIIDHIDRIIFDCADDVLVGVPVENQDMKLGDLR